MLPWADVCAGKIVEEDFRRLHVTDSPAEIVEIVKTYEPSKNRRHLDNLPTGD